MYHPGPTVSPPGAQIYSNVLNSGTITNLSYSTPWHPSDYFQSTYHYSGGDYIPIIGDLK